MLKVFIFKLSAVGLPAVACVLAVDSDPAVADVHVVTSSPALALVNAVASVFFGTPTKRQVSKRQVLKRPVSKRLKRQVYKTSDLQNVRFTKCQVYKTSGLQNVSLQKNIHI
jgi:hypothetical protein